VKALVDLYVQQFKTTFATMVQYRASLFIWMIEHALEPLVYLIVWSVVAESGGGSAGDYSTAQFAAYFIVLMLVENTSYTWIMFEYDYRIREGMLSPALLRPVHPIHADIADNVSAKAITMPFMIVVAVVLAAVFHPALSPQPWALAAAIPALLLGFLLRFFLEWTLAQAAFWTTRVSAINQSYFVLMLFLSGQVAPLSLFPPVLQVAANVLPFHWMLGFPVELILGRLSPAEALLGLGAQAAWAAIAFLLLRVTWQAGIRRYSAVGA
jgi:ABC-2 type transport system permease protein